MVGDLARAVAALLGLAGCTSGPCARHSDCGGGEVCTATGACIARPDAAAADGETGPADVDAAVDAVAAADAATAPTLDATTDAEVDAPP